MHHDMRAHAKRAALTLMASTVRVPYWRIFVRDVAIIFMLHRFADADRGVKGVAAQSLRASLSFLRRKKFRLGSFEDLLSERQSHPGDNPPLVVFSVDDGHAEFADVAAPIFAEFDCPVTVFLTTGPIDNPMWFWWDKVEYAIDATKSREIRLHIGDRDIVWRWTTPGERSVARSEIVEALKVVPNEARLHALTMLEDRAAVQMPGAPPPRYAAMTWADVRRCAKGGVTFGPHTVTHPMLSQISESEAEWEISQSWKRLRAESDAAVPVFCYPNGVFSPRDVDILRRNDLAAAVTTRPSYASRHLGNATASEARFHLPRFNYANDGAEFVSVVTGLDRVNSYLKQGRAGWHAVGAEHSVTSP